jgi:ribulose-phosphate 3-epimerase
MIEVIPGILEQEFADIQSNIALVSNVSDWVHIDIADNTLVASTTPTDARAFKDLIYQYPRVSFEAHLMVASPEKYIKPFVDAGFKRLIAHVESNDPREFLEQAKYEDIEVGMALDGASEVALIEPFLEEVDFVLVAAVEEGVSGQKFMPETLEKIKLIAQNFPHVPIAVVGGINDRTAKSVVEAGATRLISTSFLFADPGRMAENIALLSDA